jgi:NAD(P)-dependent dehydrogenase (short-subunit alcohol dehydrogenase family)
VSAPVAVVTGGSGGIGRACADVLVGRGYDVVLTARGTERLAQAAEELGARYVAADCTRTDDVERVMDEAGQPSVVVHASGILAGTFVSDQSAEEFDEVLEANLRSAYVVTKAALSRMTAGSRLIYISSTAGRKGMKGLTAYSASKAGLGALAQSVAAEVERDGINVHLVTPAPVRTDMIDPESGLEMWLLEPEDVASAVGWLDSLHPRVVVREIILRAATKGPFAPDSVGIRR